MPIYTYSCNKCEIVFDEFRNWVIYYNKTIIQGEPYLSRCPKCQNISKRIISNIGGLVFKGKGFYKTDYKKGD